GARIVRYADDIVILCRNGTEQPMALLQHVMGRLDLTLNEVNTYEERFDFLGFEIRMGKSQRTGKYYSHVQPSKKAIEKIKDQVTFQT
ncbi:MAG: group II intron reverse transcriptase/maturase, partial [Desulfuromusa sp.]|nr:group II intron reverse transcriptase/maturase [Desulfuromusa sp.]